MSFGQSRASLGMLELLEQRTLFSVQYAVSIDGPGDQNSETFLYVADTSESQLSGPNNIAGAVQLEHVSR